MSKGTVLVADDDGAIRTVLNQAISKAGYEVRLTSNASTLWRWISEGEGDVVVSDVIMPDGDGLELVPKIKQVRPDLPIIVMSAQNTLITAVRATEAGAYEYLPKPFDLSDLVKSIDRAFDEPVSEITSTAPALEQLRQMPLVGRSPHMQELYQRIAHLLHSDLPVLITGEAGTGKHLTARVIHEFGDRKNGNFIAVNLASIPDTEIETHLFGDSYGSNEGKIKEAAGGTLFLQEIETLSMKTQARLIGALKSESGVLVSVERKPGNLSFRLIVATKTSLSNMVSDGKFREDLYYCLNVLPIHLAALRERLEDIPDLAHHFLKLQQLETGSSKHLNPTGIRFLKQYSWPGNVRELENFLRRVCLMHTSENISDEILKMELEKFETMHKSLGGNNPEKEDLAESIGQFLTRFFNSYDQDLPPDGIYQQFLPAFEGPVISRALSATNGNQIRAAKLLGLNRNTLRKKIREHKIKITKTTI